MTETLTFAGYRDLETRCDILIEHGHTATVVTVTERDDNTGQSVTNNMEFIATEVAGQLVHLRPSHQIWFVQRFEQTPPPHREPVMWARVEFTWDGRAASRPTWSDLGADGYADLRAAAGIT